MKVVKKKHKPEKTVDEVLLGLPRAEQVIVKRLRNLILECLPKATESVTFGTIPLYRRNRMICFIWPPSMYWGPKRTLETQKKIGVGLCFCQGNLMANEDGALLAEGRKQAYCMYFKSATEINEEQLRALFFEAGMVDESFARKRKKVRQ